MSRILFFGDAAATGFGTVTADLGRALLDMGHDVRFVSQNEIGDLPEPFGSRTFQITKDLVDPNRAEALGLTSLALAEAAIIGLTDGRAWEDGWKPEAGILLGDYYAVEHFVFATPNQTQAFRELPTFHYVPIEGVDLPPSWKRLWNIVHPVAMSEFGAEQIQRVMGGRPRVAYHGVDAKTFRPVGDHRWEVMGRKLRSKEDCKRLFGGADARIVFRADRLMPRKRYPSLLRAMAPVMAKRPDVRLLLHCATVDEGGHLDDMRSKLHPSIRNRVIFTGFHDNGISLPRDMLAALYNAADVYASPSAEGFGLTIAEAMACGVPAVGMDYSSVTEVIGPGGLLAPVNHLVDNEYDHAWAAVDERVFGEQVAKLLDDEPLRKQLGRAARRHVVETFTWQACARVFSELVEAATRPAVFQEVAA
jgi:glycosyltransferase involved in cell wall biosynthesis